jgi:hypothetical protein
MTENTTLAYIEYENTGILVKTGDWVIEKSISLEHGTNLTTSMIVLIDELNERHFYKTLSRETQKKVHKSLEILIRTHKEDTSFHYIIDEASVEMQIVRTRLNILENLDFSKLKEKLSVILNDLNRMNMEAVIFSEINQEDSEELAVKYVLLLFELIEEFTEKNKNAIIRLFTIFLNPKDRNLFFQIAESRKHKYTCYSFITLNN